MNKEFGRIELISEDTKKQQHKTQKNNNRVNEGLFNNLFSSRWLTIWRKIMGLALEYTPK